MKINVLSLIIIYLFFGCISGSIKYNPKASIEKTEKLDYGHTKTIGYDKDNKKIYEFLYYPNGHIKQKKFLLNDKLHGLYANYAINGKLINSAFYNNGKLHGKWEGFRDNGKLYQLEEYKNGKLHGKLISWNDSNQIIQYGEFNNGYGYKEGRSILGKITGRTVIKINFEETTNYYENGNVRFYMRISKGKDNNIKETIYYNEQGKILNQNKLIDGSGVEIISDTTGKIISKKEYKNYLLHGICYRYNNQGDTLYEIEYNNGVANGKWKIIEKETNTELIGEFDDGNGRLTGIFKGCKFEKIYKNGKVNFWNKWWANGQKEFERVYDDNGLIILNNEFDSNGKKISKETPLDYPSDPYSMYVFYDLYI